MKTRRKWAATSFDPITIPGNAVENAAMTVVVVEALAVIVTSEVDVTITEIADLIPVTCLLEMIAIATVTAITVTTVIQEITETLVGTTLHGTIDTIDTIVSLVVTMIAHQPMMTVDVDATITTAVTHRLVDTLHLVVHLAMIMVIDMVDLVMVQETLLRVVMRMIAHLDEACLHHQLAKAVAAVEVLHLRAVTTK